MIAVIDEAPAEIPFVASGASSRVLGGLSQAPFRSLSHLVGAGAVLVIAPHADDETLGCGGLIRAAIRSGRSVLIDILTDGARSHPGSKAFPPAKLAALRRAEARQGTGTLGVAPDAICFHDHPDGYLGSDAQAALDTIHRLAERIDHAEVTAVFVTSTADPHPDHAAAFELARQAITHSTARPALYAYPIWAWTETGEICLGDDAVGACRLDIAEDLAVKRRAVDCYGSQLGRVVPDSPEGFQLTAAHLQLFVRSDETFVMFPS